MIPSIIRILKKGNTAEIKCRKDDLIVLETSRGIKYSSAPRGATQK